MSVIRRETWPRLDLDAIRSAHPLPSVVGAVVKLRRAGSEWKGCCPFHADRSPSFTIYRGGERFPCFGCGASGDVLDFIQQAHGVGLREAANMLGEDTLPRVQFHPLPSNGTDASDRVDEARAIWRAAVPVEDTPAAEYLRWRGLTLEPPISLRYAELPYGRGRPLPCLVCCVSSAEGPMQGIQRIYLAPDGRGKADVGKPKLSLGRVAGGAIRLGPLDGGELIVTEGPEDGLTLLQSLGRPVWVAAGASMLPAMRFPDQVCAVAVGGDNDSAGRAAADKAAEAFAFRGLKVRTFFPDGAKDFNAMLTEASQ
jgi:DNA primase